MKTPKNHNKVWDTSDTKRLSRLASQGFTTLGIARKLGRTTNAIYSKASKENITLLPKDR